MLNAKIPHVTPLTSNRTGRAVPNQTVLNIGSRVYLQSYDSIVACHDCENNRLTLGKHWDYSVTTMKYVNQFIRDHADPRYVPGKVCAENIRKAIDCGLIEYNPDMI